MTIFQMLEQSAILTVLGMAVVFTFLWIMIVCVNLASKIIGLKGGEKEKDQSDNSAPQGTIPEHIPAITAAVAEYQKETQGL